MSEPALPVLPLRCTPECSTRGGGAEGCYIRYRFPLLRGWLDDGHPSTNRS